MDPISDAPNRRFAGRTRTNSFGRLKFSNSWESFGNGSKRLLGMTRQLLEVAELTFLFQDSWIRSPVCAKTIVCFRKIEHFLAGLWDGSDRMERFALKPSFEACSALRPAFEKIGNFKLETFSKLKLSIIEIQRNRSLGGSFWGRRGASEASRCSSDFLAEQLLLVNESVFEREISGRAMPGKPAAGYLWALSVCYKFENLQHQLWRISIADFADCFERHSGRASGVRQAGIWVSGDGVLCALLAWIRCGLQTYIVTVCVLCSILCGSQYEPCQCFTWLTSGVGSTENQFQV